METIRQMPDRRTVKTLKQDPPEIVALKVCDASVQHGGKVGAFTYKHEVLVSMGPRQPLGKCVRTWGPPETHCEPMFWQSQKESPWWWLPGALGVAAPGKCYPHPCVLCRVVIVVALESTGPPFVGRNQHRRVTHSLPATKWMLQVDSLSVNC